MLFVNMALEIGIDMGEDDSVRYWQEWQNQFEQELLELENEHTQKTNASKKKATEHGAKQDRSQ
jgi:hypothetical protein